MAKKSDTPDDAAPAQAVTDTPEDATSPLVAGLDQEQFAVTGTGSGVEGDTDDVRAGPLYPGVGDPKDNPVLPDDVSAVADPNQPSRIIDAGADPDLAGR